MAGALTPQNGMGRKVSTSSQGVLQKINNGPQPLKIKAAIARARLTR